MNSFQPTGEQYAVIRTTQPRVIVSACAGSGKTQTLCARIRRLLDRGVLPAQILVLSFSNHAVRVLRERIRNEGIAVMTFHAFGQEIVRAHAAQRGQRAPSFPDPKDRDVLLKSAIDGCPKACAFVFRMTGIRLRNSKARAQLAAFFDRVQGNDELARSLVDDPGSGFSSYRPVLKALRAVRLRYERALDSSGSIDYAGMLRRGCELLRTGNFQLPYRHVLIDEAQDMSGEQAQLLAALVQRVPNVMAFGDEQQAIFGFMGARFRHLQQALSDAVTLSLSRSFRLTHETAALANAIVGIKGHRVVGCGSGKKPLLYRYRTAGEQEDAVIRLIGDLKRQGVAGDRIAILARTGMQLRHVEMALRAAGHETEPTYKERMPEHTYRFLHLLAFVEKWKWAIESPCRKRRIEKRLCEVTGVSPDAVTKTVLEHCRRMLTVAVRASSPGSRYVAARRVYARLVVAAGAARSAVATELERWEAISREFGKVDALRAHIAGLDAQPKIVTSTIHGAKGSEWDHVIVLGVTEGSLPLHYAIGSGHVDEEQRLFYVAVTRARDRVYLFHAPYHHVLSGRKFSAPSRFLTDRVTATFTGAPLPRRPGIPVIRAA
ncbi:ATP-dependent helicase [Paraburkholderia steynii]|nr:ATP-dependent helicase [Paraburkholderia steynii]